MSQIVRSLQRSARTQRAAGLLSYSRMAAPAVYCIPIQSSRGLANKSSPYVEGAHRSNAERLVNKVPVVEVDGHVAVCDGGGGALGHPVEYIQLDTVSKEPAVCKYCGLRFKAKHHH